MAQKCRPCLFLRNFGHVFATYFLNCLPCKRGGRGSWRISESSILTVCTPSFCTHLQHSTNIDICMERQYLGWPRTRVIRPNIPKKVSRQGVRSGQGGVTHLASARLPPQAFLLLIPLELSFPQMNPSETALGWS